MIPYFFEDKEFSKQAEDSIDEMFDLWKKEVYEYGIVFLDDTPPLLQPLLLTRYTLDKMDESWNKILEYGT